MRGLVAGGFGDPVEGSQRQFRALLTAMSEPGRVVALGEELPPPPPPLARASFALALTLLDFETPLWLDRTLATSEVIESLRFHCGCPIVEDPARASFAIAADQAELPELDNFSQGTPEYPDRSTTLFLQVDSLGETGASLRLRGPGIESERFLRVEDLASPLIGQLRRNHRHFPLGVDTVLIAQGSIAALPRSVDVELL